MNPLTGFIYYRWAASISRCGRFFLLLTSFFAFSVESHENTRHAGGKDARTGFGKEYGGERSGTLIARLVGGAETEAVPAARFKVLNLN